MAKNKTKTIHLKDKECSITYIITDHGHKTVKNLFKKYEQMHRWEKEGINDNNFSGFAFDATFNDYFFIFNLAYPPDHNTITHESWHLSNYILEARAIVEDKHHEGGAWLCGFIAEEAYRFLEERGIKITYSNGK